VTLRDGELLFEGFTFGDDVSTFTTEVTGWDDLPPVDSGNSPSPMRMGSLPGRKFARERVVTWSGRLAADRAMFPTVLAALRAATTVVDTETEQRLTVRTVGEELVVSGHVTARSIPDNRLMGVACVADVSVQWTCADPRRYTSAWSTSNVPFPAGTGDGLEYPLEYPLDYGSDPVPGSVTVLLAGDVSSKALYTITGPVDTPAVYNDTTGRFMEFGIVLTAADVLVVDTQTGEVLLNGTADRLYTKTVGSSPLADMELAVGENRLRASGASWSAGATVTVSAPAGAYL
jgi:hypothetical protein